MNTVLARMHREFFFFSNVTLSSILSRGMTLFCPQQLPERFWGPPIQWVAEVLSQGEKVAGA
jgi:hypothetical protein